MTPATCTLSSQILKLQVEECGEGIISTVWSSVQRAVIKTRSGSRMH